MSKQAFTFNAVILAAGAASRMGERPKCLLELGGKAIILHQIEALQSVGAAEIIVVTGYYAEAIEATVRTFANQPLHAQDAVKIVRYVDLEHPSTSTATHVSEVKTIRNPAPEQGQASSLRVGLQALHAETDAVLISLADLALLHAPDLQALITAHQNRPAACEFTAPQVGGLPGNPVIFSQLVRTAMLQASEIPSGKAWQAAHPEQIYRWQTDNMHYRSDLDSPEDIEALRQTTGLRLEWPSTI